MHNVLQNSPLFSDILLEEIGIEFRDFPSALELFKKEGADVDGERVRFPRGLCRQIINTNAHKEYIQHARNPNNNVIIGGPRTVLVPAYGSPFVRDLDEGRRYATIEDFRNFVKLAYMSPHLHHSGGTICEPVDIPVNKRHFDMVYSHIKYSDKPSAWKAAKEVTLHLGDKLISMKLFVVADSCSCCRCRSGSGVASCS